MENHQDTQALLFEDILEPDGVYRLARDVIRGRDADPLESDRIPDARTLRRAARRRLERIAHAQALDEVIPEPPAAGETVHIVSNAKYDFWTWVPHMLGWLDRADELYCSTWTLSRANAVDLFQLWDQGKVAPGRVGFLTGLYFKRRETAVYTMLLDGLLRRGGRYRSFRNHAKVVLLSNAKKRLWLTVEGSANLTSNPRLEQYTLSNDRQLYRFHREWMEEMLGPADHL